jgi:hypothetical protein
MRFKKIAGTEFIGEQLARLPQQFAGFQDNRHEERRIPIGIVALGDAHGSDGTIATETRPSEIAQRHKQF